MGRGALEGTTGMSPRPLRLVPQRGLCVYLALTLRKVMKSFVSQTRALLRVSDTVLVNRGPTPGLLWAHRTEYLSPRSPWSMRPPGSWTRVRREGPACVQPGPLPGL